MLFKLSIRNFCKSVNVTKEVFAQFKGIKYATTINLTNKMTVEDFCSNVVKKKTFLNLKEKNEIEYSLKNNYLLKTDNIALYAYLMKEDTPLMIFEDNFTPSILKERKMQIWRHNIYFQACLDNLFESNLNMYDLPENKDKREEKKRQSEQKVKKIKTTGVEVNNINSTASKNQQQKLINNLMNKSKNTPDNDVIIERITPEENIFNLPIDFLEDFILKNGINFRSNHDQAQKVLDLIFTYFAASIEKEYPLKLELNQVIRPISYAERDVSLGLTNSETGKIFAVNICSIEHDFVDSEEKMHKICVQNLHILKRISRSRHNDHNTLHFGVVTDILNWKFTVFQRPDHYYEVEKEDSFGISTNYSVDYNARENKLDWKKITELLKLVKQMFFVMNDEYKDKKGKAEDRWKDAINVNRKVKI